MSMEQNLKERIYGILEPGDADSRLFDFFIITLIILNIIAFTLETIPEIGKNYSLAFKYFEVFSIVVFSIEGTIYKSSEIEFFACDKLSHFLILLLMWSRNLIRFDSIKQIY